MLKRRRIKDSEWAALVKENKQLKEQLVGSYKDIRELKDQLADNYKDIRELVVVVDQLNMGLKGALAKPGLLSSIRTRLYGLEGVE